MHSKIGSVGHKQELGHWVSNAVIIQQQMYQIRIKTILNYTRSLDYRVAHKNTA